MSFESLLTTTGFYTGIISIKILRSTEASTEEAGNNVNNTYKKSTDGQWRIKNSFIQSLATETFGSGQHILDPLYISSSVQ